MYVFGYVKPENKKGFILEQKNINVQIFFTYGAYDVGLIKTAVFCDSILSGEKVHL